MPVPYSVSEFVTMVSVGTLLICWIVSLSVFHHVGASPDSQTVASRPPSPAVRHAGHACHHSESHKGELVKASSLLLWHPLRVFRLVPQTLCCMTTRFDVKEGCNPVWERTDTEMSGAPTCRSGHLREGDRVPNCIFKQYTHETKWHGLDSRDMFDKRRVVIIGLPGAFTPVCTSWHLPAFEAAYDKLKAEGIDAVYCITVNDTFVTAAWGKHLEIKKVVIIPDGNGCFTSGMGMLVRKSNLGFGCRSWRYAAVITDGVIEKLFVEPCMHDDAKTDPHSASTADKVLSYLRTSRGKATEEKVDKLDDGQLTHRERVSSEHTEKTRRSPVVGSASR